MSVETAVNSISLKEIVKDQPSFLFFYLTSIPVVTTQN